MFIIMTGISGRLLVDRLMRKNGLDPHAIGSLERLAIVGVRYGSTDLSAGHCDGRIFRRGKAKDPYTCRWR